MEVWDRAGPVGVDVRHVFPLDERASEGVEETFFGLVDFGDAKDVVNVADDGEAGGRDKKRGCVADIGAFGVDIESLDIGCLIAVCKAVAINLDKSIKVAFSGCGVGEPDLLAAAVGGHSSTSALFT